MYNGRCRNPQQRPDTQNKTPAWRIQVPDRVIVFQTALSDITYKIWHTTSAISSCFVPTAIGHISLPCCRRCRSGHNAYCPRSGLARLHTAPNHLQQCLGVPTPAYAHLPLLTNSQGQKWSKQTLAPALDLNQKEQLLRQVLTYLNLPDAPTVNRPQELLDWAVAHWQMDKIPKSSIITD